MIFKNANTFLSFISLIQQFPLQRVNPKLLTMAFKDPHHLALPTPNPYFPPSLSPPISPHFVTISLPLQLFCTPVKLSLSLSFYSANHLSGLCSPRIDMVAAPAAKSLYSCLTLCDPIDGSPSGSSVPGILQARILEWVTIPSPELTLLLLKLSHFSRVRLCVTP